MDVLNIFAVGCNTRESTEAFATLVQHLEVWHEPWIFVKGEIGGEGWAAIQRAVDHPQGFLENIEVRCEREVMVAGRREDLKAIFAIVDDWLVDPGDDGPLWFPQKRLGEKGGWEGIEGGRRGLDAVIGMSEQEWLDENRRAMAFEELESSAEEQEEDSWPE